MADEDEVDAFLEHHGVKGMKWGVRKKVSNAVTEGKTKAAQGVGTAVGYALAHPVKTAIAVDVANVAYKHRGEIAGTAVIAGKIGAYAFKQAFAKDPEVSQYAAIGRQVAQGFVVNG